MFMPSCTGQLRATCSIDNDVKCKIVVNMKKMSNDIFNIKELNLNGEKHHVNDNDNDYDVIDKDKDASTQLDNIDENNKDNKNSYRKVAKLPVIFSRTNCEYLINCFSEKQTCSPDREKIDLSSNCIDNEKEKGSPFQWKSSDSLLGVGKSIISTAKKNRIRETSPIFYDDEDEDEITSAFGH